MLRNFQKLVGSNVLHGAPPFSVVHEKFLGWRVRRPQTFVLSHYISQFSLNRKSFGYGRFAVRNSDDYHPIAVSDMFLLQIDQFVVFRCSVNAEYCDDLEKMFLATFVNAFMTCNIIAN